MCLSSGRFEFTPLFWDLWGSGVVLQQISSSLFSFFLPSPDRHAPEHQHYAFAATFPTLSREADFFFPFILARSSPQIHRMIWVGRELWRPLPQLPALSRWQGTSRAGCSQRKAAESPVCSQAEDQPSPTKAPWHSTQASCAGRVR